MSKTRTKEQVLNRNGFDFRAFEFENEYSAKNLLSAMDEYKNDAVLRAELSFMYKYSERIGLDAESRIEEINTMLAES